MKHRLPSTASAAWPHQFAGYSLNLIPLFCFLDSALISNSICASVGIVLAILVPRYAKQERERVAQVGGKTLFDNRVSRCRSDGIGLHRQVATTIAAVAIIVLSLDLLLPTMPAKAPRIIGFTVLLLGFWIAHARDKKYPCEGICLGANGILIGDSRFVSWTNVRHAETCSRDFDSVEILIQEPKTGKQVVESFHVDHLTRTEKKHLVAQINQRASLDVEMLFA